MTASWQQKVIYELAEVKRKLSQAMRPGTVYKAEKDKVIVLLGYSKDGKPYYSPWLDTADHRGSDEAGPRVRRKYTVGQNVHVCCPDGDPAKAFIMPFAPHQAENNEHNAPDHADNEEIKDGETFQFKDLRGYRQPDGTWNLWIHKGKEGAKGIASIGPTTGLTPGTTQKKQKDDSLGKADEAVCKIRLHKDFITGRFGSKVRFACSPKGAKVWAKGSSEHYCVATPDLLIVSEPPIVASDKTGNDDK